MIISHCQEGRTRLFAGDEVWLTFLASEVSHLRIQAWSTNATNALCNTSTDATNDDIPYVEGMEEPHDHYSAGPGQNNATVLYNAMIYPFVLGPMHITGITWFQAEANAGQPSVYACAFPAMINQWKKDFGSSPAFLYVVMEPWITTAPLAQLRDAQLAAQAIPGVGYGAAVDIGDPLGPWGSVHVSDAFTNADAALATVRRDHPNFEGKINGTPRGHTRPYPRVLLSTHATMQPRAKQIPSARLAAAAMNIIYGKQQAWTGLTFNSAAGSVSGGNMVVTVSVDGAAGPLPVRLATDPGLLGRLVQRDAEPVS